MRLVQCTLVRISRLTKEGLADVMRPSPGQYAAIDGLRALSVCLVILFHSFYLNRAAAAPGNIPEFVETSPWFLNWVWQGDKGVDVFFVISGFLISSILWREQARTGRIALGRYYWKRFMRIAPAYLVLILAGLVLGYPNREWFWTNLLYVNNWLPLKEQYLTWTWTIAVEMQFYLLFPLLFVILNRIRRPGMLLIGLFLLTTGYRAWLLWQDPWLYQTPFYLQMFELEGVTLSRWGDSLYLHLTTRAGPILLGILTGLLHIRFHERARAVLTGKPGVSVFLALVGLTLVIGVLAVPYQKPSFYPSGAGTLAHAIFLAAGRNLFSLGVAILMLLSLYRARGARPLTLLLQSRLLHPLARISYSVYLFHIPVMTLAFAGASLLLGGPDGLTWPGLLLTALLDLLLASAVALFVYVFWEKPGIDIGHNLRMRDPLKQARPE
jgi:peptidoglycan/LPS O-acetylase OafA/YrhL